MASIVVNGTYPARPAKPSGYSQHPPVTGAIPRTFNGVTFRSTTEARFAALFSRLGLVWSYEAEGYTDGDVSAMPDFWLPRFAAFLEIKHSDDYNRMKPAAVARASGTCVLVATSAPWFDESWSMARFHPDGSVSHGWTLSHIEDGFLLRQNAEPCPVLREAAAYAANLRFWSPVR